MKTKKDMFGTNLTDSIIHSLHASIRRVTITPLVPRDVLRFVVEFKYDPEIGLVASGHGLPEGNGVLIGHVLLGSLVPVQV